MQRYFFFFLFFYIVNVQSQKVPQVYGISMDSIQRWVMDKPGYFRALTRKFKKTDLTDTQMVMLYYGTAFLPEYNPKEAEKEIEKIYKLTGDMDFQAGLKMAEHLMNKYPVNARLYMLAGYAAKKTGDNKKSDFYYKKYADLLRVPLYSGNGKSFKEAYIVRSTGDEFLILNQKDIELLSQEVRYYNQMPFDRMLVHTKNNPKEKKEIYFNIYLPLFVANHTTYKDKQLEAIKKYKVDPKKYPHSIEKIKKSQ
jgi:hypothetical protein